MKGNWAPNRSEGASEMRPSRRRRPWRRPAAVLSRRGRGAKARSGPGPSSVPWSMVRPLRGGRVRAPVWPSAKRSATAVSPKSLQTVAAPQGPRRSSVSSVDFAQPAAAARCCTAPAKAALS